MDEDETTKKNTFNNLNSKVSENNDTSIQYSTQCIDVRDYKIEYININKIELKAIIHTFDNLNFIQ